MNAEQLEKGNHIAEEIKKCKANIEAASYMINENVALRETYLSVHGTNNGIAVPESLFRVMGKLIMSEYNQKLIALEREFESL